MSKEEKMSKGQLLKMSLQFFGIDVNHKVSEVITDLMSGINKHGENYSLMHLCEVESKHGLKVEITAKLKLPKPNLRNYLVYNRGR